MQGLRNQFAPRRHYLDTVRYMKYAGPRRSRGARARARAAACHGGGPGGRGGCPIQCNHSAQDSSDISTVPRDTVASGASG